MNKEIILDPVFYSEILGEHFIPSDDIGFVAFVSLLTKFRELGGFCLLLSYLTTLSVAQICGRTKPNEYMFDAYYVFIIETVI
jgi:hypothetical protein